MRSRCYRWISTVVNVIGASKASGNVWRLVAGCGRNEVDQALNPDANGYSCRKCQAKFYTEREVFATRCPECKESAPQLVMAFVCAHDQQVTLATRGKGSVMCTKCGKPAANPSIPREADFKAWGAVKRTAAEVGG